MSHEECGVHSHDSSLPPRLPIVNFTFSPCSAPPRDPSLPQALRMVIFVESKSSIVWFDAFLRLFEFRGRVGLRHYKGATRKRQNPQQNQRYDIECMKKNMERIGPNAVAHWQKRMRLSESSLIASGPDRIWDK